MIAAAVTTDHRAYMRRLVMLSCASVLGLLTVPSAGAHRTGAAWPTWAVIKVVKEGVVKQGNRTPRVYCKARGQVLYGDEGVKLYKHFGCAAFARGANKGAHFVFHVTGRGWDDYVITDVRTVCIGPSSLDFC